MRRLLLDVGNSAVKWRYVAESDRQEGGWLHAQQWDVLPAALDNCQPEAIWLASVAGVQAKEQLQAALARVFSCPVHEVRSAAETLGVINAYQHPERLGVDRWLGVVEGFHRAGACIVIDAGSAITLDAVDATGKHLGGYIFPGLGLLERALLSTAEVRFETGTPRELTPGTSTQQAVQHGVLLMAVGGIERAVVAFQNQLPDTCQILMAGGDAPLLQAQLAIPVTSMPGLVLSGLERLSTITT